MEEYTALPIGSNVRTDAIDFRLDSDVWGRSGQNYLGLTEVECCESCRFRAALGELDGRRAGFEAQVYWRCGGQTEAGQWSTRGMDVAISTRIGGTQHAFGGSQIGVSIPGPDPVVGGFPVVADQPASIGVLE